MSSHHMSSANEKFLIIIHVSVGWLMDVCMCVTPVCFKKPFHNSCSDYSNGIKLRMYMYEKDWDFWEKWDFKFCNEPLSLV